MVRMPITLYEVVTARLISVEIPSSFYVFKADYGNTSMRVTVHDTVSGPITKTITIDDGNYNGVSIGAEIQAKMDDAFAPLTFSCAMSQTTLKFQMENLDGYHVEVHTGDTADHIEYAKTLPYFLGFEFDTVTKANPVTSQHVANINPYTYAYIDIPELGSGVHEGGMYGTTYSPSAHAFSKIPINNNSFEYTFWEPQTQTTVHMNPVISRLDRITVRWRFHDMTPIDFHNANHSFSIEFTTRDPKDKAIDDIANNVAFITKNLPRLSATEEGGMSHTTHTVKAVNLENPRPGDQPIVSRQLGIGLCCFVTGAFIFWYFHRPQKKMSV